MSLFVVVCLFILQECYFLPTAHTPLDRLPNTKRSDWTIIKLFLWVHGGQSISYCPFCMVTGLNTVADYVPFFVIVCVSDGEQSKHNFFFIIKQGLIKKGPA